MNPQLESFSRAFGLFQNLGAAALTGVEELMSFQLDQAQALIARGSKQLQTSLSEARNVGESGLSPEVVQQSTGSVNAILRDALISSMDYELEMFRLVQKQAAEAQQLVSETIYEQLATVESSTGKRTTKSSAFAQKLAA